ncbi:sulfate respiration complex hexadecaheme cytochrome HmcA [Desulfomonile tiedjei]|uniref:Class III cytochrome C family protein n=1 Tax=Desulfomonile tiedjei (strain ATCC 49306 / DSM 6799 / DCB-1) TaxID=706587 RepID=I4CEC9_DESTA|nr:class III cytochrome C family protein [Desulfomonile tiedjei DSM 6799]
MCDSGAKRGRLMQATTRTILIILSGFLWTLFPNVPAFSDNSPQSSTQNSSTNPPILISHLGSSPRLERPPVVFDHDMHTKALKQSKGQDCAICHIVKDASASLSNPEVKVFKFPKSAFDPTDKTAIMYAYHEGCVSCHRTLQSEGKKSGPDIGLCGKCHKKRPEVQQTTWAWSPIFNYARHGKHVEAVKKLDPATEFAIADKVQVVSDTSGNRCELCHHQYDEKQKKLIYKKDTENSCQACHKSKDEKNARSMQKVAHSACIGCHMKLAEKAKAETTSQQGSSSTTSQNKFGPFECKGCHGEHKELTPEEIMKVPRLVRGQKDVMDLALVLPDNTSVEMPKEIPGIQSPAVRMKAVTFNHKAHEPRAQFCNACHHNSLEKCVNCHTQTGDVKKGGGISYERAFHMVTSNQACIGCHAQKKQDQKCAGCHQWLTGPTPSSSCPVCHRGPSNGKAIDVPPMPLFQDKEKVPDKVVMKLLEKEFKPAEFAHLKIVNKLVTISNESSLARWFHSTREQALCAGCHHRSEFQQAAVKVPKCTTCHNKTVDLASLGKPTLMGAYHRQCIGCHGSMKQKPTALECAKCHAEKGEIKTALEVISHVPANK